MSAGSNPWAALQLSAGARPVSGRFGPCLHSYSQAPPPHCQSQAAGLLTSHHPPVVRRHLLRLPAVRLRSRPGGCASLSDRPLLALPRIPGAAGCPARPGSGLRGGPRWLRPRTPERRWRESADEGGEQIPPWPKPDAADHSDAAEHVDAALAAPGHAPPDPCGDPCTPGSERCLDLLAQQPPDCGGVVRSPPAGAGPGHASS